MPNRIKGGRYPRSQSSVLSLAPLVAFGLGIEALLVGLFIVVGYLNWYPSRLGAPAEWLEDHLTSLARPLLGPGRPIDVLPVVAYLTLLLGVFIVYLLALRHAFRVGPGDRRALLVLGAFMLLFSGSLLLQPYLLSQDIFSYAYYARILGHYGSNPYVTVPRDYPFDPLFDAIFWRDQPSNYGPLWSYMTALLSKMTDGDVALTILSFKSLVTVFALLGLPFVWAILGRLSPQQRLAGTLLYAWNPLLIVETAGSGHNDAVMAFLLLPAIWFYLRGRRFAGLGVLVLSILVKYLTVVLLPMYLILWLRSETGWRSRLVVMCGSAALIGGLSLAAYLPVYAGPATFQVASFGSNPVAYINSPPELLFRELRVLMGEPRELASLPLRFRGWWVANRSAYVTLWAQPDDLEAGGVSLPTRSPLLVVEPQNGDWLHVYEPRLDRFGYVQASHVEHIPPPRGIGGEGTTAAVLQGTSQSPIAQQANVYLRLGLGAIFAMGLGVLTWRTRDPRSMIFGWLMALLLSYWLVQTWFWPWYLIWAVGLAALLPRARESALVLVFSVLALALYAQVDAGHSSVLASVYQFRSLAIFGLPLAITGLWLTYGSRWSVPRPAFSRRFWVNAGTVGVAVCIVAGVLYRSADQPGTSQSRTEATPVEAERYTYALPPWADHYWRGVEHFDAKRYDLAVAELSEAILLRPTLVEAYDRRYRAYLLLQRFDEEIEDLDTLLAIEGERYDRLVARGSAYLQRQRYVSAMRDFDRAVALDPSGLQAYHWRAIASLALGRVDQAIDDQWKAIVLWPNRSSLYRELGQMYATTGDFERALSMYDQAIALDRTEVSAYVARAAVLRRLGRDAETIPDLRRILVLSDDQDERRWAEKTIVNVTDRKTSATSP